jgi:hypothetical protein
MDVLLDSEQMQSLHAEIEAQPPRPHHSGIVTVVQKYLPSMTFRHALSRGGWHRLGGVIRPDGTRVAQDIEAWTEAEVKQCGDDLAQFFDRYAGEQLLATRWSGRTHYFVATYGAEPSRFFQLEVEEMQEVLDRQFIDPSHPPDDLADLVDPARPVTMAPQPVGSPVYRFRRLIDMQQAMAGVSKSFSEQTRMRRFMEEWVAAHGGKPGHFCDHWIVALREHHDRYYHPTSSAAPMARNARALKTFAWNLELRGAALANQIRAFDRAAGYAGAWYFHAVAGTSVPHDIAIAVGQDQAGGFSYLPEVIGRLVQNWLANPYAA